ncbi:MAG: FtsX-like permease family protein [Peptoniphilus sp.]|nr:FtsX-like permease family protein [Peptoniphilus sp.]MDY6045137.1 FtsX-like permease family protein [Peptoniphilus sp.]
MRFFSLAALIAIGVFVLVGLMVTGPIMRNTVANSAEETDAYDLKLSVMEGLESEDIARIERLRGVRRKEYFHTAYLKDDKSQMFFISSMPKAISKPRITEGRAPSSTDEILLDRSIKDRYKIGDTITFQQESDPFDKDAKPTFNRYDYKVVGFATSIQFLNEFDKGISPAGDAIDSFGYVMPLAFRDPTITEAQFQFDDLNGLKVFDERYAERSERHKEDLKKVFADRPQKRLDAMLGDMRADIQKGEADIEDGYNELDEAKASIRDGERDLKDGEKRLKDAREDYKRGVEKGELKLSRTREKLAMGRANLRAQEDRLDVAEQQWRDGKKDLASARAELKANEEAVSRKIAESERTEERSERDPLRDPLFSAGGTRPKNAWDLAWPELPALPCTQGEVDEAKREIETLNLRRAADQEALEAAKARLEEAERDYEEADQESDEAPPGTFDREQDLPAADEGGTEGDRHAAFDREDDARSFPSLLERRRARREERRRILAPLLMDRAERRREMKRRALERARRDFEVCQRIIQRREERRAHLEAKIAAFERAVAERARALEAFKAQVDDRINQIRRERRALEETLRELRDKKYPVPGAGSGALDERRKNEEAIRRLEMKKRELDLAERELGRKKDMLDDGRAQLASAKRQLDDGERRYEEGARELEAKKAEGQRKLDDAEADLLAGRDNLQEARAEYAEHEEEALKRLRDGQQDVDRARELITIVKKPKYEINPLDEDETVYTFLDYSHRIDMLAKVFPVFLFAVALLLASTVMNRMVDEDRTLIGTYKALGYSKGAIASKYVTFGTAAALLGGIPGGIAGNFLLSKAIADAYLSGGSYSALAMAWYPATMLISIGIGMFATGFVAFVSIRRSLAQKTATLLLPKRPAKGTRIALEHLPGVWKRLSFFQKVTARNLARDKKRGAMTIFGILGCVALLVLGFGIRTSVNGLVTKQFDEISRYQHIVLYEPILSKEDHEKYLDRLSHDTNIQRAVPGHMEYVTVDLDEGLDQTVMMIVPEDVESMKSVVTLRDRKSGEEIDLNQGAVITEKLAQIKGIEVGDELTVVDEDDEEHEVPVAAIAEGYAGHYIYMNASEYERDFDREFKDNMHYLATTGADVSYYRDYDSVLAFIDTSALKDHVDRVAGNLNFIVFVILAASSLLAVVVISTLTNINIEERRREISTIRVLGFYPKEVTRYIYRETGVLTAVGILIGFIVGKALHALVIRVVVPDFAMLDPALGVLNYAVPMVITIAISLALMVWFHRKLQTIDMVEALKGVE